jgi:hypothetical protein
MKRLFAVLSVAVMALGGALAMAGPAEAQTTQRICGSLQSPPGATSGTVLACTTWAHSSNAQGPVGRGSRSVRDPQRFQRACRYGVGRVRDLGQRRRPIRPVGA